jgi:hypothetical protein
VLQGVPNQVDHVPVRQRIEDVLPAPSTLDDPIGAEQP